MTVLTAIEVFGTELRLRLIRHYLEHPGTQADASRALGINSASINRNTTLLVGAGVLHEERNPEDRRFVTMRVDLARYDELLAALRDFIHAPQPLDED